MKNFKFYAFLVLYFTVTISSIVLTQKSGPTNLHPHLNSIGADTATVPFIQMSDSIMDKIALQQNRFVRVYVTGTKTNPRLSLDLVDSGATGSINFRVVNRINGKVIGQLGESANGFFVAGRRTSDTTTAFLQQFFVKYDSASFFVSVKVDSGKYLFFRNLMASYPFGIEQENTDNAGLIFVSGFMSSFPDTMARFESDGIHVNEITGLIGSILHANSHFYPQFDSTYDLGSPSFRWRNLYATKIFIGGSAAGTVDSVFVGNLSPLFTTTTTNPKTHPSVNFSLVSQSPNLVYASPTSGSGNPAFRALTRSDITFNVFKYRVGSGAYYTDSLTVNVGSGLTITRSNDTLYFSVTIPNTNAQDTISMGYVFSNSNGISPDSVKFWPIRQNLTAIAIVYDCEGGTSFVGNMIRIHSGTAAYIAVTQSTVTASSWTTGQTVNINLQNTPLVSGDWVAFTVPTVTGTVLKAKAWLICQKTR